MEVIIAMKVFVLSHMIVARTKIKPFLIRKIGKTGYTVFYSLLSFVLLGWVIYEVLVSDRILLWATPIWAYYFAALFSLLGFILIGIGFTTHNVLSAAFRKSTEKNHSSFSSIIRHPIILGASLWGIAHIPANGDVQSLFLFGGSAAFGLIGMWLVDKRKQKEMGMDKWQEIATRKGAIDKDTIIGAIAGIISWAAIALFLHAPLFKADPLILWR